MLDLEGLPGLDGGELGGEGGGTGFGGWEGLADQVLELLGHGWHAVRSGRGGSDACVSLRPFLGKAN